MTDQQEMLFTLFGGVLVLLLWGKFRSDLVAMGGVLLAVIFGAITDKDAFVGFSHPAVIVVAFALLASRAIENSGALAYIVRLLPTKSDRLTLHIVIIGGIGALMSAFINNVAALAILMPIDIEAARRTKRSPSLTLMPLSFATILGGMVTMIGTPPNIIASEYRAQRMEEPFSMFAFTPVGLVVALVGLCYIALIGWRLAPNRNDPGSDDIAEDSYSAEVFLAENSTLLGKSPAEILPIAEDFDILFVGIRRGSIDPVAPSSYFACEVGDRLILHGSAIAIASFIKANGLRPQTSGFNKSAAPSVAPAADQRQAIHVLQAIVRSDSPLAGRTAQEMQLRSRFAVTLFGIARGEGRYWQELKSRQIEAGDMLLFGGGSASLDTAARTLRLAPVTKSAEISKPTSTKIALAVGPFLLAIGLASAGLLPFAIGLGIAVCCYAVVGLLPANDFYQNVEWPSIVFLSCLLTLGIAFDKAGGSALIASMILDLTQGQPAVVALIVLMIITMTMSDVLNSVATMVIAAPLSITIALKLGVNPDTFLMGTTIAASCSFLTPIGHKNNTLIMAPGKYRFSDYWRVGLPLEIIVLIVGVPALLFFWPLDGAY